MQSVTPVSETEPGRGVNWGMGLGIAAAIILFIVVIAQLGLFRGFLAKPATMRDGFTLTTSDFQFGTDNLHLKAGETVTLYLSNQDLLEHAFDVDELGIHIPVAANDVAPITFTVTEPGTYTFYCGISGHRDAGMVGTLIIAP